MTRFNSSFESTIKAWLLRVNGKLNNQQTVYFTATPASGTYILTLNGYDTAAIAYDASNADIKAALELLTGITEVTVTGDYANGITIEISDPEYTDFDLMEIDVTSLDTTAGVLITQKGVDGLIWIYDKQKHTRPQLPYGTIDITRVLVDDYPSVTQKTDDTVTYHFKGEFNVELNIYADSDHLLYMAEVERSLSKGSIKEYLVANGIFYRTKESANDLSRLLDNKYEFRCQNEFVFGFGIDEDEISTYIERVSGSINDVDFDESE